MKEFIKELCPYIVILILVVIIRTYIVTPVIVSGSSMVPTLENKELLIVRKIGYDGDSIKRFDIVVVKDGEDEIIKRVIGLPGEHISYKNNKLYVNNKYIEEPYNFRDTKDFNLEEICTCSSIPDGQYLVLGDNRPISKDSRRLGLIEEENIVGKAEFRIWPIGRIGSIYN